jgi:acyl transferase domain-containing protein
MQQKTNHLSSPWVLTAASAEALRERASALLEHLDGMSAPELAAMSSTLAVEAVPETHRAVLLGGSRDDLRRDLADLAAGRHGGDLISGEARDPARVAFVFPPVRTEHEGMIVDLLAASPTLRHWMDECEAALEPYAEWSLDDVLHGRPDTPSLYRLDICQHALFATCTSLARLWEKFGVRADAVLGHSFGEVPAATISGSLTLAEAARVINSWGRSAMRHKYRGEMAVIALPAAELAERVGPWRERLWISAVTGPTSTSVSGEKEAVEELLATLAADGIGGWPMRIRVPTHSPAVRVIYRWCDEELHGLAPRASDIPFYSGVVGHEVDQTGLDPLYWASNLAQRVHFEPALRALLADGYDILVEVGPRRMLAESLRETADDAGVDAVIVGTVEQGDSSYLLGALAELFVNGVEVDWSVVCGEQPEIPIQFWTECRDAAGEGDGARLVARLADVPEIEREAIVLDLVRAEVAQAVGLGSAEINPGRPFKDLGFDSPKAVDLRNRLSEVTGLDLSTTIAFDYPTPRDVAHKLLLLLDGEEEARTEPVVPSPDEEAVEAIDELDLASLVELSRRQRDELEEVSGGQPS